jgi:proteasome alpha subunit
VATAALGGQAGDERREVTAAQLEVAVLDRSRAHRCFRRLTGARLEALLAEARAAARPPGGAPAGQPQPDGSGKTGETGRTGGTPEANGTPGAGSDPGSAGTGGSPAEET